MRVLSTGLTPVSVTKSDATTYDPPLQAIYVGTGGTLLVVNEDGGTITFTNVPNGAWIPVRAKQVLSTSTTASDLVGAY